MKKSDLKVGDEVVFKNGYADNARGVIVSLDPEDYVQAKNQLKRYIREQEYQRTGRRHFASSYYGSRENTRAKVVVAVRYDAQYGEFAGQTVWGTPQLVALNMIHAVYNDEYVAAFEAEQQRKKELAEKTQRYYEERTRTNQEKADKLNRLLGLEDVFGVERYGYSKGSLSGPSWDKIADKLIELLEEVQG